MSYRQKKLQVIIDELATIPNFNWIFGGLGEGERCRCMLGHLGARWPSVDEPPTFNGGSYVHNENSRLICELLCADPINPDEEGATSLNDSGICAWIPGRPLVWNLTPLPEGQKRDYKNVCITGLKMRLFQLQEGAK